MTMASEYDWRDDARLTNFLRTCLSRGQLAVCLGAGVSLPFNIPSWRLLIDEIAKDAGVDPPDTDDLLDAADYLEDVHFGGQRDAFVQSLRQALYARIENQSIEEQLSSNRTLQALGALCVPSIRGSVKTLVSFNYDDLLEIFLERYGVNVHSITACNYLNEPTDVKILHPHGFLPLRKSRPTGKTVVITQKDIRDTHHNWVGKLWNEAVIEVFRRHVVLFIGVSGEDDRLMQLIDTAWRHHSLSSLNSPFFGVRLDAGGKVQFQQWNRHGVYVREIEDFSQDIASFLLAIKGTEPL